MNNYLHETPKGIDIAIQRLQTRLFQLLNWPEIEVYGRVYKNPTEKKGVVPEAYKGKGEYVDVFTNDRKTASIFFVDDDSHKSKEGILYTTKLKIVFMIDLKKAYPSIAHRADMEAEMDAIKIIRKQKNFLITDIEKGVKTALKDFDTESMLHYDMQPLHVFSVTGDFTYQISC